jgi:hypothetical protein
MPSDIGGFLSRAKKMRTERDYILVIDTDFPKVNLCAVTWRSA